MCELPMETINSRPPLVLIFIPKISCSQPLPIVYTSTIPSISGHVPPVPKNPESQKKTHMLHALLRFELALVAHEGLNLALIYVNLKYSLTHSVVHVISNMSLVNLRIHQVV